MTIEKIEHNDGTATIAVTVNEIIVAVMTLGEWTKTIANPKIIEFEKCSSPS